MIFHFKKMIFTIVYRTDCRGTEVESIEIIYKTNTVVQVTDDGVWTRITVVRMRRGQILARYKVELTSTYCEDLRCLQGF